MIKKILLASSVLSLAGVATAAETEVYVIKDGKMVNCEFVEPAAEREMTTWVEESENEAGEAMVLVANPEEKHTAAFLYLPKAVDLNKTWNLEVEYYFNKDVVWSGENIKREGLTFDLMADTMALPNDSVWKTNKNQIDYRISHVSIDCSFRDFYSYVDGDSIFDRHGVGTLNKVTKYVYSTPLLPAAVAERGDANKVKAIFVTLFNQGGVAANCYIKNLKFVSDGIKPFYADKFTKLAGEGTIYTGGLTNYVYGYYTDTEITAAKKFAKYAFSSPNQVVGQQMFSSRVKDAYFSWVTSDRMYTEKAEQSAVGFYDTEYGFLPYLKAATEDNEKVDDKTNDTCDAVLRVPLGDAVNKTISVALRLGHNAGSSGDLVPYANYIEKSKDIRFPLEYRFESGDATTISNKTEWMRFRPTYTKGGDDYVDSIPTQMQMVYGDVELPSKEYTYLSLRFVYNDVISYMFTDLTLTGDIEGAGAKKPSDFTLAKDWAGNMIPVGFVSSSVENVIAKGEISIYPNPATDVVTVANEGVKSVAIYTVAGSKVASSESNVINVASLAKGIYVVKANTEAGVITGQIIKK